MKTELLDTDMPPVVMTATEAMAHLFLTRSAFYDYVRAGVIPQRADGKFDSTEIRRAYLGHLRAAAERRGASSGDTLSRERARQARTMADALEMKNRKRREELEEPEQVRANYAEELAVLRSTLTGISGKIEPDFAGLTPAEAAERVAQLIDGALIEMHAAEKD